MLQCHPKGITQKGYQDVSLHPRLLLVEQRPNRKLALERAKRGLRFGELHVHGPHLLGRIRLQIGTQHVGAFSQVPPRAQPLSPMKALALLSTLQSADIVLPTTDGREIRLRRITEPTTEQKSLLHQLGLSLPERLKSLSKCSADRATACTDSERLSWFPDCFVTNFG